MNRLSRVESILLAAVAAEIALLALTVDSFFTVRNAFEVARLSVELGLLAVALTPIVVTGGIDLSVGAMLGLSAVVLGAAYRDWHVPIVAAIGLALLVGCVGGLLNAMLISRWGIPPLIVTLGSLSVFRGIAEGMTQAAENYSGFPARFLALGQGYLFGVVPWQLLLFAALVAAYVVLLHRSILGRSFYAIGFVGAGVRYAGIPVAKRIGLLYFLSGVMASLAAIVYVARVGQARSDAGTGYELDAITVVVLGGTSVFGGRGSLWGTLLGLSAITILQNGLHLAGLPSELVGLLTATLLVGTIAIDRQRRLPRTAAVAIEGEEPDVKNSQVAILCGAILAGALLVAGTNVWLVRSLASGLSPGRAADAGAPAPAAGVKQVVVAMMPKAKGDPYFISCRAGAEEAARALGVQLIWDGPTSLDAAKQNELVESWITRKVDVIAVAVENRAGISTVLRKARQNGIHVLTWDADAEPDARDFFVNQATAEGIANALTDEAARLLNGEGQFAIVTGALTAANQNEWIRFIRQRLAEKYPKLTLATIRPSDDDRDKAFAETQTIMKVYPSVALVMAISAPAVPGAAEAVQQARRTDVRVIGLSLPNINKPYVHNGVVQTVVLWNTRDLGYLTVYASALAAANKLPATTRTIDAGRLGVVSLRGSEIILGPPLLFNKGNIDQYDF
jgi:rhamnose transport system permease protein